MIELLINGNDALQIGVRMGEGFISTLTEPLSLKEPVANESRLQHGKRVVIGDNPRIASREITLDFTICGNSPDDLRAKKRAFLGEMYKGKVTICVPPESEDVYHLVYRGKGPSTALTCRGRSAIWC